MSSAGIIKLPNKWSVDTVITRVKVLVSVDLPCFSRRNRLDPHKSPDVVQICLHQGFRRGTALAARPPAPFLPDRDSGCASRHSFALASASVLPERANGNYGILSEKKLEFSLLVRYKIFLTSKSKYTKFHL